MFDITYANQADNNCSLLQQSYNFTSLKKLMISSIPVLGTEFNVPAMYLSPSHYQEACDRSLLSQCWDESIFQNSPLFFMHTDFKSMLKNIGILDMFETRRRLIYQNIFDKMPL